MIKVIFFVSAAIFSAGAYAKCPHCGESVSTSQSTTEFYNAKVEPVLQAIQLGNVSILDTNCTSPSFSSTGALVTATVSGQNFYVVLTSATVNGRNYSASVCQATAQANGATEVDCAATEQNPQSSPAVNLSFDVEYLQTGQNPNFYTIYKCPQAAP